MKREIREEIQNTKENQKSRKERKEQVQNIAISAGIATLAGIGLYFLGRQVKRTAGPKPNLAPEKQRKAANWIKEKFNEIKKDKVRVIKVQ